MSDVIYARVPSGVKSAADAFARANGRTISSALAELIDRGLQSSATVSGLQARIAELGSDLASTRTDLAQARSELVAVQEAQDALEGAYRALAERLQTRVGRCPSCQRPVKGDDVLISGRCPNVTCQRGLTSLLVAEPTGNEQRDLLLLVGAVGLVLGIALIQAKQA